MLNWYCWFLISEDGKTPLHIAAELGYVKIVRDLLENGAKSMINQPEKTGCTPLTLACMTDHRETATCLMIYGAAINFDRAFPPLHAAALMGYTDLVRMLLDRGAYVNLIDVKGETALHYAAYKSHKQIVQLLLQKGAIVSCFDARRKTPVDLATDEEIKRLLENKLKTENDTKPKGRKDSGARRLVPLDMVPAKSDVHQPRVEDAILEEDASNEVEGTKEEEPSDTERHKNNVDKNRSSSSKSDNSEKDKGLKNKLNVNHNNSLSEGGAAAFPEKKMSQQSTYSADSETGERKTKAVNVPNHVSTPRDHDGIDEPSTSKDMRNGKISEERNVNDGASSEVSDNDDDAAEEKDDEESKKKDSMEKQERKVKKKKKGCTIL